MSESAPQPVTLAPALQLVLITTFILFLTAVLGGSAIIRYFRHRRQKYEHLDLEPTEHVDAWQLHKTPKDHET